MLCVCLDKCNIPYGLGPHGAQVLLLTALSGPTILSVAFSLI